MQIGLRSWPLITVLAISLMLAGCIRPVQKSDAAGQFSLNKGGRPNTLDINADGTYRLTCQQQDGTQYRHEGRWEFRREDGESRITFDEFIFCDSPSSTKPAYWDVAIQRSWNGQIRMAVSLDRDEYYIKR